MMDNQSRIQAFNEEKKRMQRRARQRLIGAIALVSVMVIVLPMVFHSPQLPVDAHIEIVDPPRAQVLPVPTAPLPAPVSLKTQPPVSTPLSNVPSPPIAQLSTRVTAPVTRMDALPEGVKALKRIPPKVPPPEEEAASSEDDLLPSDLEPKRTTWSLQFAALSDPEKATRLLQTLSTKGIRAFVITEHTEQGELSKVRAGVYSVYATAEAARRRMRDAGFTAVIVNQPNP